MMNINPPPAERERTSLEAVKGRNMLTRSLSRTHAFGDLLVVPIKYVVRMEYEHQWLMRAERTMECMEQIQMYWEEVLAGREKEGDAVDLKPGVLLCPEDYRSHLSKEDKTVKSAREPHMVLVSCEMKAGVEPYLAQIHDMKELAGLFAKTKKDKGRKVRVD
jgi:hypothetical protein